GVARPWMRGEDVPERREEVTPDGADRHPDVDLADRVRMGAGERRDLVGDHLAALLRDLERARDHDRRPALHDVLVTPVRVGPRDHLDDTFLVLEHERRVAVALLAVLELEGVDDAAEAHAGARVGAAVPLAVPRRKLPAARAERRRRRVRELPEVLL